MQRASTWFNYQNSKSKITVILSLRQCHRRIFAVLGVLLPLLFVVGIVVRRNVPQSENLPPGLSPQTVTFTATGYELDDLFEKSPVRARLYRDHESGTLAVGLTASKDFLKPDLMVYWSSSRPATGDTLPPEAKLLGAFVSATLVLPPEASTTDGQLTLFSLANQEIVDVSKPTRFTEATK
jgi:hypothetical protein